jgi:hypothetical protein
MTEELETALAALTSTYQDLHLIARGLKVDAEEVAEELAKATPDTAEFVALEVLAKYHT